MTTFGFSYQANAALTDGLVAHWSFDDCTAKDNSGNGHDGVINGNPKCETSIKGKTFNFDGVSDYISIDDKAAAFSSPNLSVSVWINPKSTQQLFAGIIDKSHAISPRNGWVLQRGDNDNHELSFYMAYCDSTYCTTVQGTEGVNIPTSSDKWSHLVFAKQGGTISSYLNGQLLSTTNYPVADYPKTDLPLMIGRVNDQNRYFNGAIDEIRIYSRALSADEVQALYSGSSTTPPPPISVKEDPNVYVNVNSNDIYKGESLNVFFNTAITPNTIDKYDVYLQIEWGGNVVYDNGVDLVTTRQPLFKDIKIPELLDWYEYQRLNYIFPDNSPRENYILTFMLVNKNNEIVSSNSSTVSYHPEKNRYFSSKATKTIQPKTIDYNNLSVISKSVTVQTLKPKI